MPISRPLTLFLPLCSTLLILVAACGPADTVDPPATNDAGVGDNHNHGNNTDAGPVPEEVTYTEHVRPIFAQHCISCHKVGSIAPFALDTYEDAKMWAMPSALAVAARRMPPHPADGSGACNTFENLSWLTASEISTVEKWAETGSQEGDPSIPEPAAREFPTLQGEVVTVDIGADYLPDQSKTDDYRCFVVESPGALDFTGYNITPGNNLIAHHLIAYQVIDEDAAAQALALDAESEIAGYDCLGTGPLVDVAAIGGWAPGGGAEIFPEGLGGRLTTLPLILEMHYNIAGGPNETDRTSISFGVAEAPVALVTSIDVFDFDFVALPGLESFRTVEEWPVTWLAEEIEAGAKMRVLSSNAHMHQRGIAQRIERVKPDGTVECLLDIPAWDFNWQMTYRYKNEVLLDAGDSLRITCDFDTQGLEDLLTWGEGTADEMCLGSLVVIVE